MIGINSRFSVCIDGVGDESLDFIYIGIHFGYLQYVYMWDDRFKELYLAVIGTIE